MKTTNTKKVTLPNGEVIPIIFSAESESSAGTLLLRKVAAKVGARRARGLSQRCFGDCRPKR